MTEKSEPEKKMYAVGLGQERVNLIYGRRNGRLVSTREVLYTEWEGQMRPAL
jgi:hypothetical protein